MGSARSSWSRRSVIAAASAAAACSGLWPKDQRTLAMERGRSFLLAQQRPDGSFRGAAHDRFASGLWLTPLVLLALARHGAPASAVGRGLGFLVAQRGAEGALGLGPGPVEPVYTTSLAVLALAAHAPAGWQGEVAPMVAWLRSQQLAGAPWLTHDERGGFPIGAATPTTPPDSGRVDLRRTRWALQAMAASGAAHRDVGLGEAHRYVLACRTGDGGFRMSLSHPEDNKGTTALAATGIATCEGVLALGAVGGADDAEEGVAWLTRRFRVDENPGISGVAWGAYARGTRYYWRAALGESLATLGGGPWRWGDRLAAALVDEQMADGSWVNEVRGQHEDEPVLCTALALLALHWAPRNK